MTSWRVTNLEKKNVFEHELWQKDDFVIRRITGWRWGSWFVDTEDNSPPTLLQDSGPYGDAVDMNMVDNCELDSLDDGWFEDFIWPDDMPEEERDRIMQIWEDDYSPGLEEDGWVLYDTECWVTGPLSIEECSS